MKRNEMITVWRRVVEVDLLAIWQKMHAASAPAIFLCLLGHYCVGTFGFSFHQTFYLVNGHL